MKRRFPPYLTQDVLSTPDPRVSIRILVSRQSSPEVTVIRRPRATDRIGGGLRAVPPTNVGLGSMTGWVLVLAVATMLLGVALPAFAQSRPVLAGLNEIAALTHAPVPARTIGGGQAAAGHASVVQRPAESLLALAESAEVDGEGIFLDQIVTAPSGTSLPHVRLTASPAVGQAATLTRAQVIAWMESLASAVTVTRWIGADSTRVTRRMRNFDESDLREMLQETLQREYVKDRGELDLRLTRSWSTVAVADEPLSLKVMDLPATGVGANFIVRFELWAGQERLGSWQVAATAKVWREVLIAETSLKRGQLLRTAPLSRERRDVLALREAALVGLVEDGSGPGELELKENVGAGQPILARSIRVRPVVFRGSIVDGVILDGGMTINLKVEVLEDGLPGNVVRVRNPRTRREMLGKVYNERTILIPL